MEPTAEFLPATVDYAARVRSSFAKQAVMGLIGAELATVRPGLVEIRLPFRADLTHNTDFYTPGLWPRLWTAPAVMRL